MRFSGKRIIVTGAAQGIGAATVALFRNEGANVVSLDISDGDGILKCDVSNPEEVDAVIAKAIAQLGGLDVLANVAGVNYFSKIGDMTLDVWNKHLAVNLTGPMLVTKACLAALRESKGNIVTVGSISGLQGQPYNSSYCASKGGLMLFMRALAVELAADGIRVNLVAPGGVDTAMSTNALNNIQGEIDFSYFPKMMGVLGAMMPPERIADAIAHFASDAAASTTGATLVVDNGTLW